MSRREPVTRVVLGVVLGGTVTALVISLIRGSLWTISMLWEIALWIALLAVLASLESFLQRRRRAKRL